MTTASHSPLAATLTSLVSVQVGAAVAKTLFPQVGPEGVAALRLGLAALVLVLWLRPWTLSLDRSNWLALLGYGTVMAMMNLLIYRAFDYIPVGIAISIEVLGAADRGTAHLAPAAGCGVGLLCAGGCGTAAAGVAERLP